MQLSFSESISALYGRILSAQVNTPKAAINFKITPDMFCREWFEVTMEMNNQKIVLGKYVSKIEEAKQLCEAKLKEFIS